MTITGNPIRVCPSVPFGFHQTSKCGLDMTCNGLNLAVCLLSQFSNQNLLQFVLLWVQNDPIFSSAINFSSDIQSITSLTLRHNSCLNHVGNG
jgi:hypothetical protein